MPETVKHCTFDEYLEYEEASERRHSFFQGEVSVMPTSTFTHSRIIGNSVATLHRCLTETSCSALSTNMRISTPSGLHIYPDVLVFCGDPELTDNNCTLLNPALLIEVLSPRTKNYDRGDKFLHYRSIPSLQDYLLIDSESIHIEHYQRQNGNEWLLQEYRQADSRLHLKSIDKTLSVASIYHQVTFET